MDQPNIVHSSTLTGSTNDCHCGPPYLDEQSSSLSEVEKAGLANLVVDLPTALVNTYGRLHSYTLSPLLQSSTNDNVA